jgi:hypothetical protein
MDNTKIFLHFEEQDLTPVDLKFESITNIDSHNDNSFEEISIQDLLDYIPADAVSLTLEKIVNKLAPEGKLHIQGTDLKQIGIAIAFNKADQRLIKSILYPHKKSIATLSNMVELIKSLDLIIEVKKYINVFEYYVCAKKKPNDNPEQ